MADGVGRIYVEGDDVTSQPPLFSPAYQQPVDTSSQVDRMPGTINAPCICQKGRCEWPFCTPPKKDE